MNTRKVILIVFVLLVTLYNIYIYLKDGVYDKKLIMMNVVTLIVIFLAFRRNKF